MQIFDGGKLVLYHRVDIRAGFVIQPFKEWLDILVHGADADIHLFGDFGLGVPLAGQGLDHPGKLGPLVRRAAVVKDCGDIFHIVPLTKAIYISQAAAIFGLCSDCLLISSIVTGEETWSGRSGSFVFDAF